MEENDDATTPQAPSAQVYTTANQVGCFDNYRDKWPKRPADLSRKLHDDEVVDMSMHPEAMSLLLAPARIPGIGPWNTHTNESRDQAKFLWLIRPDEVKLALEYGPLGRSTLRGRLAHTNLSGSLESHCGGELWFKTQNAIYFNGGSGRFMARSEEELTDAALGFAKAGYNVCNFGWDAGKKAPSRVLRDDEIQWITVD